MSEKLNIDFNGHFHGNSEAKENVCENIKLDKYFYGDIYEKTKFSFPYSNPCFTCGETRLKIEVQGNDIKFLTPCAYPEGYPEYRVQINIPSGKIIFGNDFRDLFEEERIHYSLTAPKGQRLISEAYAELEMFHFIVGNTCPHVFQFENGEIHIARGNYKKDSYDFPDEDWEDYAPAEYDKGSICTDLWWYSAMDYELFKKLHFEKYDKIPELNSVFEFVLDVEPGLYEATGRYHLIEEEPGEKLLYSVIKRVGECKDKKKDKYRNLIEFIDESAENTIQVALSAYPSLYPDRNSYLNRAILTSGSRKWRNGALTMHLCHRMIDAAERLRKNETILLKDEETKMISHVRELLDKDVKREKAKFFEITDRSLIANIPDDVRLDWLEVCKETIDLVLNEENSKSERGASNIEWARKIKTDIKERFEG